MSKAPDSLGLCCPPTTEPTQGIPGPSRKVWRDPSIPPAGQGNLQHGATAARQETASAIQRVHGARAMGPGTRSAARKCHLMGIVLKFFCFTFQKSLGGFHLGSHSEGKFREKKVLQGYSVLKAARISSKTAYVTENHFPENAPGNTIITFTAERLTVTTFQNR